MEHHVTPGAQQAELSDSSCRGVGSHETGGFLPVAL